MHDQYTAHLRGAKIAPRKARLVVNLVRGKLVQSAIDSLKFLPKKGAPIVAKLIQSALANASSKPAVDVDRLFVKDIFVGEGPAMKRFLPRAQGRATQVKKRTSHITVTLEEI